eukprot:SAG25_NODE_1323_length_3291_cov_3.272243_1_plen_53_part_00
MVIVNPAAAMCNKVQPMLLELLPAAPPRPDPRCIGAAVPRVPEHQRRGVGGA